MVEQLPVHHDGAVRHVQPRQTPLGQCAAHDVLRQRSQGTGVADRTLRTWVKIADEQGFEQLRAVKQEGRPTRLNAVQTAELKDVLTKSPSNYGYKVWDGPSLSSYIKKTYQIELKVRQCQRLFHKLGFSLIRPQTYPSLGEQNKEEREDFKKRHFT